jgi:hypothetical protein
MVCVSVNLTRSLAPTAKYRPQATFNSHNSRASPPTRWKTGLRERVLRFRSTKASVSTEKKFAASVSNGDSASLWRLHRIFAVRFPIASSMLDQATVFLTPRLLHPIVQVQTWRHSAPAKAVRNSRMFLAGSIWYEKTR